MSENELYPGQYVHVELSKKMKNFIITSVNLNDKVVYLKAVNDDGSIIEISYNITYLNAPNILNFVHDGMWSENTTYGL